MVDEDLAAETPKPSRRSFLRRAVRGCVLGGVGALGYAYGIEPHWIDVVAMPMPMANLPQDLVGCRIVQISDIHVGESLSSSYMMQALSDLRQLEPDLIVITGDFMTSIAHEQIDQTLEILEHLPEAPLGYIGVLGNHDYGRYTRSAPTAQRLTNGLGDIGVRVLRNAVIDIAGLQIAGLDELLAGRCLIQPTLQQLDPQRAMLTLCHNPDAVDQQGWEDFQGWILAGHTHGGQCRLPGCRPPYSPVWNKDYISGAYQLSGNRQMYINRGLGYYRRVRFNCRPEVTVFTLAQADKATA